ncbi:hypothetical protein WAI453_003992 [Rhynchosporium graminicola]|uniref:Uncharacterized protein n=1 Tax=Rhynchosporium graminicola TaxID=2792576 RepID=A0A1E1JXU1_9HELO|nr:uncharacterized protein RCO7_06744 [Rhynchosporium commune]
MPIRNPFAKRSDVQTGLAPYEEGIRPLSQNGTRPVFEKVDTTGSKASSAMSIKSGQEPVEYKMSVVNDSGVYLPPSPPEKKGFWPKRSHPSVSSISTRNSEDIEPFSISRESFDSYRRSFDISAKSPVIGHDLGRQSLDSARLPRLPRSAMNERRFERQPPTAEEGFEDVGLNDEQAKQTKKKGFFAKFGEHNAEASTQSSTTSRFHIGGRKRAQSGVGEELGNIPRPDTPGTNEVKEVH